VRKKLMEAQMGAARQFDQVLKDQLNIHAAWVPILNTFKIGDYGVVSDGVFVKIGNISSDFGVSFEQAPGQGITLNFTSKGTNIYRVAGSAEVNVFPESDAEAKFTVEFNKESSFLLRANLAMTEMQNLNQVAQGLSAKPDWRNKFRVVHAVYIGRNCALISSTANNSKIELVGKAKALKQFDIGAASVEVSATNKREIGLDLLGKTGVVGLGFFKLGWWSGEPKTLAEGTVPIELSKDVKNLIDDI
jgi:hypothetical protein